MSAFDFFDAMHALLRADVQLNAALASVLQQPVLNVLASNMPVASIPTDMQPCWIIEQGDGITESLSNDTSDGGLVIGLSQQQFGSDIEIALLWQEQDREAAARQRSLLPTLIAQLMLRNPQPGGIDFAQLTGWEPDRGIHHPQHIWRATLRGQYVIQRT